MSKLGQNINRKWKKKISIFLKVMHPYCLSHRRKNQHHGTNSCLLPVVFGEASPLVRSQHIIFPAPRRKRNMREKGGTEQRKNSSLEGQEIETWSSLFLLRTLFFPFLLCFFSFFPFFLLCWPSSFSSFRLAFRCVCRHVYIFFPGNKFRGRGGLVTTLRTSRVLPDHYKLI